MSLPAKNQPNNDGEPRLRVRVLLFAVVFIGVVVGIVLLTAVLIYNAIKAPAENVKAVAPNVTVTTFLSFPEEDVYPMGLARSADGTFYLTQFGTGAVLGADLQGKISPLVTSRTVINAPGAVAIGPDNAIYVIDYSSSDPQRAQGTIRRIDSDGKATPFGTSPTGKLLSMYAQMAFDDSGNLFVTNPSAGQIWRFDADGSGQLWWTLPGIGTTGSLPTALAFDAAHHSVIVGDAGTGTLFRVNIDSQGKAGNSVVVYRDPQLVIQAITLDDQGRILFADWNHANGRLNRIESDESLTVLAQGLREPTALAFHDSKAYVVNSQLLGLLQVLGGSVQSPLQAHPPFTVDVISIGS